MTLSLAEREWIVYAARHNAIIKALSTAIDPLLEGPSVNASAIQEGLMFEEALAYAISGTNAIRQVPLRRPWRSMCQAGALSNPADSYRRISCSEEFSWREDLDFINSTITAVMDCAMQMAGVTGPDPTSAIPLGRWWDEPDDPETRKLLSRRETGVARAALAASMYMSSKAFDLSSVTTPSLVNAIQILVGQTATLRSSLRESAESLRQSEEALQSQIWAGAVDLQRLAFVAPGNNVDS